VRVHVYQEHIDRGYPHSATNCPVALAIRDVVGTQDVSVIPDVAYVGTIFKGQRFDLPEEVSEFIFEFDADGDVAPFEFEMEHAPYGLVGRP